MAPPLPPPGVPAWPGGAVADGPVVGEERIDHRVRHPDAAEPAAVGAGVAVARGAAEGAIHHVDGLAVELTQDADRRAADIRADVVAHVVEEA